jgi:hypothetical protein
MATIQTNSVPQRGRITTETPRGLVLASLGGAFNALLVLNVIEGSQCSYGDCQSGQPSLEEQARKKAGSVLFAFLSRGRLRSVHP